MLMKEVHEGTFGTHAVGHAMTKKLLRSGYYWITMDSDCCQYARKCHKCQKWVAVEGIKDMESKVTF